MTPPADIAANLAEVRERIAEATRRANRQPGEVTLVAVTKGHPAYAIRTLLDLGVEHIGESYVDEATAKQDALVDAQLTWHMIGHVQSRKAAAVAGRFQLVHSLDSLKLAQRLDRFAVEAGRKLPVLLECNVGGESSKQGWAVSDKKGVDAFVQDVQVIASMQNLEVRGLMSMAPIVEQADAARPYFARTRKLAADLADRFPQARWSELSMGMSDDYEAAILEGATLVRIGTAILGARPAVEE
jgi:pyridoxal phosphate enzyme (YggS family)